MKLRKNVIALSLLGLLVLTSCTRNPNSTSSGTSEDTSGTADVIPEDPQGSLLGYEAYNTENDLTNYDHDIFFRNELKQDMGDPAAVYEDGYYYVMGTHGDNGFKLFRSTDLVNWEDCGLVFQPEANSWSTKNYWAPDIKHIDGKWYLYYTASKADPQSGDTLSTDIGVAVADKVTGPYKQFTGTNADGETITASDKPFKGFGLNEGILDQTVFQDDDGQLYMYFSFYSTTASEEHKDMNHNAQEIYGVKMKDPVTWDFSTLKRLVAPGYEKIADQDAEIAANAPHGSYRKVDWETWSPSFSNGFECVEGPFMIKKNGRYLLTYCANSYVDTTYNVGYAIASSPLGDFVKPNSRPQENMIIGIPGNLGSYINNRYMGYAAGVGHASIFQVGDQYMFAYHAHQSRNKWSSNDYLRALGFDYLKFTADGLPYSNGPTFSLTPLPTETSGLKNVALESTFKVNDDVNKSYLNDDFTNRAFNTKQKDRDGNVVEVDPSREAQFKKGLRRIQITLPKKMSVKTVLITNSYDYSKSLKYIDKVSFGEAGYVEDVVFNSAYVNDKLKFIYPHSDFIVDLNEAVITDNIYITIDAGEDFAIGEIQVLAYVD